MTRPGHKSLLSFAAESSHVVMSCFTRIDFEEMYQSWLLNVSILHFLEQHQMSAISIHKTVTSLTEDDMICKFNPIAFDRKTLTLRMARLDLLVSFSGWIHVHNTVSIRLRMCVHDTYIRTDGNVAGIPDNWGRKHSLMSRIINAYESREFNYVR